MSLIAFVLVVISAILHACWNIFGKKVSPTVAFFTLAFLAGVLPLTPVALPLAVGNLGLLEDLLPYLLISGICQAIYSASLALAYAKGEISVAYPLARALPVLLVAWLSAWIGLQTLSEPLAYLGIVLVLLGALLLPMKHFRDFRFSLYSNRCTAFALLAAFATAGYSVVDKLAIDITNRTLDISALEIACLYIWLEGVSASIFLLLGQGWSPRLRHALWTLIRTDKLAISAAGFMITLTYLLVLWAMQYSENLSYVVALRQLSIPVGALLGAFLFKEFIGPTKLSALVLLCIGLSLVILV